MSEPETSADVVTNVLQTMQGMSDADWQRLIKRLNEIDPDFSRALINPLTGEAIVPKYAYGARPPRHESGSLT